MNIIRLFLFLFLIWVVWSFFKRKNSQNIQEPPVLKQGVMVSCKYCGLHIPTEEAIHTDNATFCCIQHSKL